MTQKKNPNMVPKNHRKGSLYFFYHFFSEKVSISTTCTPRWATITTPLPRHIALWWVLGAGLLLVYTVVKFYLLKVLG